MLLKLSPIKSTIGFLFFTFASLSTNAAFIDFDDLELPEKDPWSCYIEGLGCEKDLDAEYAPLGIIFLGDTEWYWGFPDANGNIDVEVTGYNSIGIRFTGKLPNFVSFNIDSPWKSEASLIEVYGENGDHMFTKMTSGWTGLEETSTPYILNELASIYSDKPIHMLHISSVYGLRVGPTIDNITFEYREVPEPAPALLIGLGLLMMMYRRYIHRSAK